MISAPGSGAGNPDPDPARCSNAKPKTKPKTEMSNSIDNSQDIIDSRDVIARIEELEGVLDGLVADVREKLEAYRDADARYQHVTPESDHPNSEYWEELDVARDTTYDELTEARETLASWLGCPVASLPEDDGDIAPECFIDDEARELKVLRELAEEASFSPDWVHGEVLIRDSYFEDYARQLADDIGAIPDDAKWPATCIDWEQAAAELRQDYTHVEFDGESYWIRS